MYDPSVGRFITEDPIGFNAGDTNLFRYVDNEPTVSTDPSGLLQKDATPKMLEVLWGKGQPKGGNGRISGSGTYENAPAPTAVKGKIQVAIVPVVKNADGKTFTKIRDQTNIFDYDTKSLSHKG
jgi:uncharacterized protein RhaS with RHS repeats